jgi:hypothetical protein
MTEMASVPNVVRRNSADGAPRAAAREERSKTVLAGRAMIWTALLIIGAVTLLPIARFAALDLETWALLQADDTAVKRQLADLDPASAPADYLEALAELGVRPGTENLDAAYLAAAKATKIDPSRAHAWAQLAWLETRKSGKVTAAALDALIRSMNACPLCSQDLIRWRLNFVLANWGAIPEDLRRQAFEHADILRWIGQNREFLAEMRVKAEGAGIPFDDYRLSVATPVRTWDLGPTPEAQTAAPPKI